MFLLGLPIGPAVAQMKYDDFVRYGDYFSEASYPMTVLEKTLFEQLKGYPDRVWHQYSRGPLPASGALVSVQISKQQNVLINLRKEFRPTDENFGDEDFYHQFELMATEYAAKLLKRESSGSTGISGPEPIFVYWVFEGKTAFPHQYEPVDPKLQPKKPAPLKKSGLRRLPNDIVVVSAGHGLTKYYDFTGVTFQNWSFQRDPHNGVLEDENNPNFATKLRSALVNRSQATVIYARDHGSATVHPPTGEPWWKVSARYYLKRILPDRPDIWETAIPRPATDPKGNSDIDVRHDIRSRPLYANHLGAQALISLHTDAAVYPGTDVINPSVRGTRIYHHPDRPYDVLLGESIRCYVEEILSWHPGLGSWTVSRHPATNKAEMNLATMPAVIAEMGFHTSPLDAPWLLDSGFQTAAMRGVEKGWRLYTEGKPCTPFAMPTFLLDMTTTHGTSVAVPLPYFGYPRFPVTAEIRPVTGAGGCSAAFDCSIQTKKFLASQPSPLSAEFKCSTASSTPTTTMQVEVTLRDADGIRTKNIPTAFAKCIKP